MKEVVDAAAGDEDAAAAQARDQDAEGGGERPEVQQVDDIGRARAPAGRRGRSRGAGPGRAGAARGGRRRRPTRRRTAARRCRGRARSRRCGGPGHGRAPAPGARRRPTRAAPEWSASGQPTAARAHRTLRPDADRVPRRRAARVRRLGARAPDGAHRGGAERARPHRRARRAGPGPGRRGTSCTRSAARATCSSRSIHWAQARAPLVHEPRAGDEPGLSELSVLVGSRWPAPLTHERGRRTAMRRADVLVALDDYETQRAAKAGRARGDGGDRAQRR